MLTRFVGSVEMTVSGDVPGALGECLEGELETLRRIDTREGKSIALAIGKPKRTSDIELRLGDGVSGPDARGSTVAVSFDAWGFCLRASGFVPAVAPARIVFGALAGACFGVAEVFKRLLVRVAPDDKVRSRFESRIVRGFSYSTWLADRVEPVVGDASLAAGDETVDIAGLLQVGAGAVGNASLYSLSRSAAVSGDPLLLDEKLVDRKNLNRCLYFLEDDVGLAKAIVLGDRATRSGLSVAGRKEPFAPSLGSDRALLLSTVDNNAARHLMQEALPRFLVQGSTSGTSVAVSVHTAVDGKSCLVCRHPDPTVGVPRTRALTVAETVSRLGIENRVVTSGQFEGSQVITDQLIGRVRATNGMAAAFLEEARAVGKDLCGALGEFRQQYGVAEAPEEPSVPFVSAFAGVQAAAEVVKLGLRDRGVDAPVLGNVLEIDLARDYARHSRLSFVQARLSDCPLCVQREDQVRLLYRKRWGRPRRTASG
jgi:molybdopterin/thiamine biosynthesis adenylyltransferase